MSVRLTIARRARSGIAYRATVLAAAATLAVSCGALSAPSNDDELLKTEQHLVQQSNKTYNGGNRAGSASNVELVGHHDLGGRGFNADVFTHEGYGYVGHWGFTDWATGNDRFCPEAPNSGIAVVDARSPSNPTLVSHLQNRPGTSAEDVVVFTARYGSLAGHDIAVAGIQVCGVSRYDASPVQRGTMLWDVTNPAAPIELAILDSGCCTRGVHELEVQHRDDLHRTFVYESVPTSEYDDDLTPSGRRDAQGRGDFRLVDITEPGAPVEVSDWGARQTGHAATAGQGCDPDPIYGHSAEPSDDGKLAFLSWWDSGFIAVDVTDPANPSSGVGPSTRPTPTATATRRATMTRGRSSSPPTKTSASHPVLASRRASVIFGPTTTRTSPIPSRSVHTARRTHWAPTTSRPATTRFTTRLSLGPRSTHRGTRTAFESSTPRIRRRSPKSGTSSRRRVRTPSSRGREMCCRAQPRSGASRWIPGRA
jgi:hypothetical protein